MPHQPYSVEQVANLLGLHVKTVRGYVRDGRLKAVRIGKQYRIAREDLEAFTGHPVAPPAAERARRARHAEVSSVVQVDAISREEMSRLTNTLMAVVAAPHDGDERLRVESIYDEERAVLKIIVIGGLTVSADLFRIVTTLLEDRR
ncbi:helix-turn-helix domain-containing protein [Microbispora corallina]|uniref:MerR family transcriptional regulator n=1 Tax=Microbispora corallina TaxID=83302 RepID=A0ABQ4G606_9ACTN|nr:helix-turn-helix domain-containing protein [Microbispora corallina]GIH42506.1 MerR family transcriptional regulator [Microbispora corallina]